MKTFFGLLILSTIYLYGDNNTTNEQNLTNLQIELQKQMDREKEYAKNGVFLMGDNYDLSYAEVNKSDLDNIKVIEPDYEFNMDDVYD